MINDCFVLVTMWFYTSPNIFQMTSMSCKWSNYLSSLTYNYSGWIVTLSLIDRLVTVKSPTKFKSRNRFKFQTLALVIILSIIALFAIPFYIYFDIYSLSNQTKCTTNDPKIQFHVELSGALIGVLIPFFLMITISAMIGRCLIKKNKNVQARKNLKKEIRLIKVMIAFSVFFLICNLPYYIQELIHDGLSFYYPDLFISNYIFSFIYNLTNQLCYTYNSSGFFVCLLTNNVFRNYF